MSIQYAGGTNVNASFTSDGTKANIVTNVMAQMVTAGWSVATGCTPSAATISIASPGVVTLAAHGLLAGDSVVFATTGTLPTGIVARTRYFVSTVLSSSAFTICATAGGTVINTSGSQSGTPSFVGTVRMATAATPWGVTMRVNIQDNGGQSVTFSVENSNSTIALGNSTGSGGYLQPLNTRVFRIIANRYQVFIFTPMTTVARGFVGFGTLYLPTFLQGIITECGWLQCNSASDTDGTVRPSFRTFVHSFAYYNPINNSQIIINANGGEQVSGTNPNPSGSPQLVLPSAPGEAGFLTATGMHWHDASALMVEPLFAVGVPQNTEGLIRGQLWDSVLIYDTFAGDTTTTFDSHNWWGLTDSNTGEKATLFLVVP